MGCVSSRTDINDLHPNIFKVMNVDEQGQLVSPGQLELTTSEMVLYQRGKSTTRWPLAFIRRYGFEHDLFSFESGRRCVTGPGIFAFRCQRAEQLFELLHSHIADQRSQSDDVVNLPNGDAGTAANSTPPIPLATSGPTVPMRPPPPSIMSPGSGATEAYLEPLTRPQVVTRTHSTVFSRLNSVSSNGPTSPAAVTPPPFMMSPEPLPPTLEHNNNKRASLSLQHSYINTHLPGDSDAMTALCQQPYMNIDNPPVSPSPSITSDRFQHQLPGDDGHLYVNVTPGELLTTSVRDIDPHPYITNDVPNTPLIDEEDPRHSYANLEPEEIEGLRNMVMPPPPLPPSDTIHPHPRAHHPHSLQLPAQAAPLEGGIMSTKVIYAVLDLDKARGESEHQHAAAAASASLAAAAGAVVVQPDSPPAKHPANERYTTIDFNKTEAVSQIVKPTQDLIINSEGSRKTRHNSTISDLGQISTRHSSSLSD